MDAIAEIIKSKFDAAYLQDQDNPTAFLENLGGVYQDLIVMWRGIVACFPQDWDIYSYMVREYHNSPKTTIQRRVTSAPEASALLTLRAWLEYKSSTKELEIRLELLDPPLLGGNEQSLIDDYLKLLVKKLDEWSANFMKTEVIEFTSRVEPVRNARRGDLFQMSSSRSTRQWRADGHDPGGRGIKRTASCAANRISGHT
jgi:exocyst complex component 3